MAAEIVRVTITETPRAATHWSVRTLAAELGVSPAMVHRVWKANRLRRWLARHPRFHMHFTPTSSLWLNLVELGDLAATIYLTLRRAARRGVSRSQRLPTGEAVILWWVKCNRPHSIFRNRIDALRRRSNERRRSAPTPTPPVA